MNNTSDLTQLLQAEYSPQVPAWKRVMDISLSIIALLVLSPLILLITIAIKIVSSGPVFFKQERVGLSGKRFMCYKFRTMKVGASAAVHQTHCQNLMKSNAPMVKMDSKGDPRLIAFGWLLRSSGLDELPQILNVLRGEMSLVGPRPCLPFEYAEYASWQKERFNTLPGLTGLWQVSGKNDTTFDQMIKFDIYYSRNKSLGLYVKIVLMTVPTLIGQMLKARSKKGSSAVAASAASIASTQTVR
ncbi:MAG: sugar transferase [Opitutaceae bacterium]|nr:sugar transferase [Opitutaceae bacterium]